MAWTEKYVVSGGAGAEDGSSEANAWDLDSAVAAVNGGSPAGWRINIKTGTYSLDTTDLNTTVSGTATQPVWWRGYDSAIGDLDDRPTSTRTPGTNMPLISWSSGQWNQDASYHWFSNLCFRQTGGDQTVDDAGILNVYRRCRFENTGTSAGDYAFYKSSQSNVMLIECYASATTSAASVIVSALYCYIVNCLISGGTVGVNCGQRGCVVGCILDNQAGDAILVDQDNSFVYGNTIYSPSGHGISVTESTPAILLANNLFHTVVESSKVAITSSQGQPIPRFANSFYNCNDPESGFGDNTDEDWDRVTELSDPLEDPANDDFRIANGANSIAAGSPGLFEGAADDAGETSYLDVGAVQRQEPAGGGGGVRNPFRGPI